MEDASVIITSFQEQLFDALKVEQFQNVDVLLGTLDAIQEQPQLLDPYLEEFTTPIVSVLCSSLSHRVLSLFQADLYHILYTFTKIRGAKVVVKFFPNHVHLLDPLIKCLTAQPIEDLTLWHSRSFNSQSASPGDEGRIEIVDRLISLAELYLEASGREREAAGLLIARLLTRKDVNQEYVPTFLKRNLLTWNSDSCTIAFRIGFLTCLCEIYKIGNRDILLAHAENALTAISSMERSPQLHTSTTLRKLRIKLGQRVALALLRPNRAEWRYKSVNNSSDVNLRGTDLVDMSSDPPQELEDIVGLLLESIGDKDTVVRYSAAKGIGRITSRLPLAYAEEILTAVLGNLRSDVIFQKHKPKLREEADEALWQGSCLAIAELCRNGALLPASLQEVLDLTLLAITFDIRKGSHSVGTAVRDAACYVMWSILRCYSTAILEKCSEAIATTLITVAMFDREVSVRRAASAAYQEGAGRHTDTIFPHRISVLSKADFFAVGQRRMSFLEVAPTVFEYDEYQAAILDYLSSVSCQHWDREIREIACKTFKVLITKHAKHDSSLSRILFVLPMLRTNSTSIDANLRHGAFFAIGEIAAGIKEAQILPPAGFLQDCLSMLEELSDNNKKGPQAPLLMSAVCHCIRHVAELMDTRATCDESDIAGSDEAALQWMLKDCLTGLTLADEDTCLEATAAAATLLQRPSMQEQLDSLLSDMLTKTLNSTVRRGQLTLLGQIQYAPESAQFTKAIDLLVHAAQPETNAYRDNCEIRKIAVTSLGALSTQLDRTASPDDLASVTEKVASSFTLAFEDYTVDARGDIGSWVREASVRATSQLLCTRAAWQSSVLADKNHRVFKNLIRGGLAQCVGKIENLRSTATETISRMLDSILQITCVTSDTRELVEQVAPALKQAADQTSASGSSLCVFEHCAELLLLDDYRSTLLEGYLVSGGSGAQSTMSVATDALTKFLEEQSSEVLVQILHAIEDIIRDHKMNDRVLIPALTTTASLLESELFAASLPYDYDSLMSVVQTATIGTRNVGKIRAAMRLYAALALLDHPVRVRAWKKLAIALGHAFTGIRLLAAELLYTVLTTVSLDDETGREAEVMALLTEQDWSQAVDADRLEKVKHYLDRKQG